MPEDSVYDGPERRRSAGRIEWRPTVSMGQAGIMFTLFTGFAGMFFTAGQMYSTIRAEQTTERNERISTLQQERESRVNAMQQERDSRLTALQQEIAARIASENLLRQETTAAVNAVNARLDSSALLSARDAKAVTESLAELKENVKTLTTASTPSNRR